jgi:dolichol-phosphate mannosyltransferase
MTLLHVLADPAKGMTEAVEPPLVSVLIPAQNEAENVGPLLAEIRAALAGRYAYEVILVDDASQDETYACALGTGARIGCPLQVLRHDRVAGQSTAVMTAARHARGRYLVTIDGDGQNDPADIPDLIDAARRQISEDFCIAGHRVARQDSAWKRLQSRIANRVRDALLHDGVPDTGCGLKLLPRVTFLALPYFDHMHRFLPALVRAHGGAVAVVPVHHRPRLRGQSKYSAWNRAWAGIIDLLGVMWLQRRTRQVQVERAALIDSAS